MSVLSELPKAPCDLEYIRLRCREDHGCWVWAGAAKDGRWPVVFFRRLGVDGVKRDFILYVRHLVWWIKTRSRPNFKGGKALTTSCRNQLCVCPAHLQMTSFSEIQKRVNKSQTLISRMKNAEARRKKSKLPDEGVVDIRTSDLPRKVLAEKHGVTVEYVRQIQRGEWRRDYSNPFAGLGA